VGGKYMPPALRALAAGGGDASGDLSSSILSGEPSPLPPTNYAPGFRRARAGTLPSNVQLAAQRFAATANTTGGAGLMSTGSTESFADQLREHQLQQQHQPQPQRPHAASIAGLTAPPTRPGLRHSTSVASSVASSALTERNSRLRSGSLTLPAATNLANPFGPSIFSSNWVPSPSAGGGSYQFDDLRSVDSGADDYDVNVHTLDYLGLDDGHRTATLSELRSRTQAALTHNIQTPSARMRASTVSNPYARARAPGGSLLPTPAGLDEDDLYDEYAGAGGTPYGTRPRVDSLGVDNSSYFPAQGRTGVGASAYKQNDLLAAPSLSARPRAISVGILDDPMRTLTRRSSAADSLSAAYVSDYAVQQQQQQAAVYAQMSGVGAPGGILKSESKLGGARIGGIPSVHFPNSDPPSESASPYLVAPASQGRSLSPKTENASQIQTPTRSLWIGNLDSSVTSEQLIHVFAPYGAIESLRLLPEKVSLALFVRKGYANI
jgi:protein JSN1